MKMCQIDNWIITKPRTSLCETMSPKILLQTWASDKGPSNFDFDLLIDIIIFFVISDRYYLTKSGMYFYILLNAKFENPLSLAQDLKNQKQPNFGM